MPPPGAAERGWGSPAPKLAAGPGEARWRCTAAGQLASACCRVTARGARPVNRRESRSSESQSCRQVKGQILHQPVARSSDRKPTGNMHSGTLSSRQPGGPAWRGQLLRVPSSHYQHCFQPSVCCADRALTIPETLHHPDRMINIPC